jgi:5'(3')-deoxyribonucleotidase
MDKPIILVDLDGVMLHHYEDLLKEIGLDYEDQTDYALRNLTYEERNYIWHKWNTFDYHSSSLSQETLGALEEMRRWARVIAVSTPMPGHVDSKYSMLNRYFHWKDVMLVADKALVKGDLIIEDKPANIENFPGHAIVYDHPYNRHLDFPRVSTFGEVPELAKLLIGV